MKKKLKRLLSFVLALVMLVTMNTVPVLGSLVVQASDSVKLYFELPEGDAASDWAVNTWGVNPDEKVTVDGNTEVMFRPTAWGDGESFQTLLEEESHPGWGFVTVTGEVSGLQFIKEDGTEYKCWNSEIAAQNLTEAYFVPANSTWYKDDAKSQVIEAAKMRDIYVVVGDLPGCNWLETEEATDANTMTKVSDTVFTMEYSGVPAGSYQYKVLQDPATSGWDGSLGGNTNYSLNLAAKSDVTITVDTAAEEKVSVQTTALEEEVAPYHVMIHFQNELNWDVVNFRFSGGLSWSTIEGYEAYNDNGFGAPMEADPVNDGWYTFKAEVPGSVNLIQGLFNSGAWGLGNQAGNYTIEAGSDVEVWITHKSAGNAMDVKVSYEAPATWLNDVTMHFDGSAVDWETINAYVAAGTSWDAIRGYEAYKEWPGVAIEEDTDNEGWYTFHVGLNKSISELHAIFNDGEAQTNNLNFTGIDNDKEYWISFADAESLSAAVSEEMPEGWNGEALYTIPREYAVEEEGEKFPVVDNANETVTFYYDGQAESIYLCGTLSGWGDAIGNEDYAFAMDEETGMWKYVLDMSPYEMGHYEYKFVVDGSWITDPLNNDFSNGNSVFAYRGILKSPVVKAPYVTFSLEDNGYESVVLAGEMSGWNPDDENYALSQNEFGDWTITVKLAEGDYEYKFVVDGSIWITDPLNEVKAENGNSLVSVGAAYTYTIYFFDAIPGRMDVDAADVWAWEIGGANFDPIEFTEIETLEDGRGWLKGTLFTDKVNLGLLPRSKGGWDWQSDEHSFSNTNKDMEVTLYMVTGDPKIYTSLPEVKEARKRNVLVEYNRPDGDYDGWNIYSWNTGLASATELYAENLNGDMIINVPVKDSDLAFDMAFCMRKTTEADPWADKDGGDHAITVPGNQTVVKAVFDQGSGVTYVLPYNKGYDMRGADKEIDFFYRDDALMLTNEEDALEGKVSVVVNGTEYAMSYDEATERYMCTLSDITTGDYAYYYVVDGERKLDAFNTKTTLFAKRECSLITYKGFENVTITATLQNEKMDYEANNLLSVEVVGDESFAREEIAGVYMDLNALGLGTKTINKDLMEGVVSVVNGTSTGKKNIPVTMYDIYGNVYQTTVSVTVVANDEKDFDWDEAIIYFAVTDRFFDGNDANNNGVNQDGSLSYHGGDFAGLEAKLDYLKDLGVNTVWITPIVSNSNVTTTKDGEVIESMGYHGYWANDFTTLNSHLGTEEEFASLIDAAHARGMKLMVDVVLNHSGYDDAFSKFTAEGYFNQILVDEDGNYIPMLRDAENTVSGDDVYSSLAGLPDFVTENEAVRDQLIDWQVNWVERFGIDYFRVDTVKHVDTTTWQAFKNELTKVDPDFKMIGELSGAGYNSAALGIGGMDSLLDFDFNDTAQKFVTGDLSSAEAFMVSRNAGMNNTSMVGSFMSSHDEDGLMTKLMEQNGLTPEDAENKFKVAAALQMTSKGQVIIYYGEEIGLTGKDNYPYQTNRYDFDWEELENQKKDSASMYNHYKKLLAIRNANSELFARGTRTTVAVNDAEGYDVFARTYGNKSLYVALNVKDEAQEITVKVSGANGATYKDLYSGKTYKVSNGTVKVIVPAAEAGGTAILELQTTVAEKVFTKIVTTLKEVVTDLYQGAKDFFGDLFGGNNKTNTKKTTSKKTANNVTVDDVKDEEDTAAALVDSSISDKESPKATLNDDGIAKSSAGMEEEKGINPLLFVGAGAAAAGLGIAAILFGRRKKSEEE